MVINPDDPRTYSSFEEYFLTEDALKNVEYDISFSPLNRYFCDAGCKICYIKDNLKVLKSADITTDITETDEALWNDIINHFYVARCADDMMYYKTKQPTLYNWFKENSHKFEYGFTDNALFRCEQILTKDIKFSAVAEITLSVEFIEKTKNKLFNLLKKYLSVYKIHNLKIICNSPHELELSSVKEIIELMRPEVNEVFIHYNFEHEHFDVNQEKYNQNNYVLFENNKLYKINRNSISLHNNSFYFSTDSASNITIEPFLVLNKSEPFCAKTFLSVMLENKIKEYRTNSVELENCTDAYSTSFKEYFKCCTKFKVNHNYNFIPKFMLNMNTTFAYKLKQLGFKETEVGLYLNDGEPIPIIDYK